MGQGPEPALQGWRTPSQADARRLAALPTSEQPFCPKQRRAAAPTPLGSRSVPGPSPQDFYQEWIPASMALWVGALISPGKGEAFHPPLEAIFPWQLRMSSGTQASFQVLSALQGCYFGFSPAESVPSARAQHCRSTPTVSYTRLSRAEWISWILQRKKGERMKCHAHPTPQDLRSTTSITSLSISANQCMQW